MFVSINSDFPFELTEFARHGDSWAGLVVKESTRLSECVSFDNTQFILSDRFISRATKTAGEFTVHESQLYCPVFRGKK